MKTPMKFFGVIAAGMLVFAGLAHADGEVVCITHPVTTNAITTSITDGGTACPWAAGSTVALQCPDCVICFDPRASTGGVATVAGDLCAKFTDDADALKVPLTSQQKLISHIVKSNADAGTSCVCKWATSRAPGK